MKNISTKQIIIYLAVLIAGLLLGWMIVGGNGEKEASIAQEIIEESEEETTWTCSMHPQIQQAEPGDCPICGMDLIPAESDTGQESQVEFTLSEQAVKLANVQTTEVGYIEPEKVITLQGKIQPDETEVNSQAMHFSGRIEELYVEFEGEKVQRGQRLASVYSPEFITAQEELLEAKRYDDGRTGLLEAARNKLKYWKLSDRQINRILQEGQVRETIDIYAEISGYVLARNVSEGEYVKAGAELFKIADLSKLWVIFDAYEEDLSFIEEGDSIEFNIKSLPGKTYKSKITWVDPLIDPQKRTAEVRAEIDNADLLLKPEMFVNGEIVSGLDDKEEVLAIPESAVMWTGKRSVVYIFDPEREQPTFEYREVLLGENLGSYWIIEDGLEAGERIVTNGTFTIDAAAQLKNKKSMMNQAEEPMTTDVYQHNEPLTGHEHTDAGMEMEERDFTASTPSEFQKQLSQSLNHYYDLKDALVAANKDEATAKAEDFQASLQNVDMGLLEGDAHMYWMEMLKPLKQQAESIQTAESIDMQRKHFKPFSNAMINTVKAFGLDEGTSYVQYCPMADDDRGAYWLSTEEQIRNPYYGDMMLKCGEVREVIEK
ncbi:MAG: efflux RND transporter periplasmic adaptor subunit [Bacteroidales bacterium]|nr:efflux RND transporter periplasmic adaptor subunit [Bacteroidales bacterium]MCF8387508.1 efflux RND transporter periplasmic adaptor subunit [Bacteroidales bacterium]MCF8399143.1 efflux RND transporter periplasmic adaptor subunit [Bacteroidales bacterium]